VSNTLPVSSTAGIKLIMFDLDGTLVDSAPDLAEAVNRLLIEMGFEKVALQQVTSWVGNGSAMLVKRALANATDCSPEAVPEALFHQGHELFFKHYRVCNGTEAVLYPGTLEMLEILSKDFQLAVVTNKPGEFTEDLLRKMHLEKYFSHSISGDTLEVKKPDPTPLLHCASLYQCQSDECIMVGDSLTDIEAASRANIKCIAVDWGYNRGARLDDTGFGKVPVIQHFSEFYS